MSVPDIKRCTFWEFFAAVDGHIRANTPPDDQTMSDPEAEEIAAWLDAPPIWAH